MFDDIEKTTKAFVSMGVKKGEIVSFLAIDTPEIISAFYALNRIGAISNMIDPRSNSKALENYFNEVDSNYVVSLNNFRDKLLKAISNTNVKKIIEVNAVSSAPIQVKVLAKLKEHSDIENEFVIGWEDFIEKGKSIKKITDLKYEKDYPATIVHTGGTTGKPKGVVLSNDNLTSVVYETINTPLPLKRQDNFLNITVPFVAFGLGLGMHVPMCLGWKSTLIPNYSIDKMIKLMKKHKPQLVMGTQTYFEPLIDYTEYDFSNTKAMLTGGMPTKEDFEDKINETIKKNGGDFEISKGYSMTEASAMGTCSYNNANQKGSNGVPLSKTIVSAFKIDSDEELKYNEIGEICLKTQTMMLGYYGNEEETKKVIKIHSDGERWLHTGDIGYVNEDGFVYIKDRIKRMIIKSGFKIFPAEIENSFLKHENIKSCSVVGMDDEQDDKVPVAFLILKDEKVDVNQLKTDLKSYIEKDGLPSYYAPQKFFIEKEFPITNVGKVDYIKLTQRANELNKNEKEQINFKV